MNIMPSTMHAILRDLTKSLENSGIAKLLIFNSHGGNEIKPILRELCAGNQRAAVFVQLVSDIRDEASKICSTQMTMRRDGNIDHFAFPTRIGGAERGRQPASRRGGVRPFRYEALEKGWVKRHSTLAFIDDQFRRRQIRTPPPRKKVNG